MSDDSQKAEGSLTQDSDIAASLKELSDAASKTNKSVSSFINTPENIRNVVEGAVMAAAKAISIDKILTLFPEHEMISKDSIRQASPGVFYFSHVVSEEDLQFGLGDQYQAY